MGQKIHKNKKRFWEIEDIYLLNGIGDACGLFASEAHPIIELPIIDLISLRWSSKPKWISKTQANSLLVKTPTSRSIFSLTCSCLKVTSTISCASGSGKPEHVIHEWQVTQVLSGSANILLSHLLSLQIEDVENYELFRLFHFKFTKNKVAKFFRLMLLVKKIAYQNENETSFLHSLANPQ